MSPGTRRRPLLVAVDDNHAHCYSVARMAMAAGFEVRQAYTGRAALRHAKLRPHVIILDVHLPDIDGFEVCRRLKQDQSTAAIPVVFLSGTVDVEKGTQRATELGALAFFGDRDAHPRLSELLVRLANSHASY